LKIFVLPLLSVAVLSLAVASTALAGQPGRACRNNGEAPSAATNPDYKNSTAAMHSCSSNH
jgi:hypothetical protein